MVFVVVMALCMYGAGFASADENDTYSVTYNLTGLTASSQETTVNQGSSMSITLTPQDGYTLPDSVPVYNDGEYHKLFGKRLKLYVGEPMELTKEGKGLNAEYLAGECARFREAVEQLGR